MAYDDDTVRAKLSSLNESQDSIMAVSQWIQFHRRHAPRTAQLWAKAVSNAFPPKRLSLIYLANEVIQQTKNHGKDEFYKAFSPIIADAFGECYTGANTDTRGKLKRVVGIWRERNIFDPDVQNAVEKRVQDVDRGRGAKGKLGGNLFASGGSDGTNIPSELKELANLQTNLSKAALASSDATKTAASEHSTLIAADYTIPTPPVHAARLNQLLKSLATAQSSLSTTLAARDALITGLEKVVNDNRAAREREVLELKDLGEKRPEIEERKMKVEDAIMRGLGAEEAAAATAQINGAEDIPRPDFEELTPPPTDVRESVEGDDGARTPVEEIPAHILATQQAASAPRIPLPDGPPKLNPTSRDPRKRPQPTNSIPPNHAEGVGDGVPDSQRRSFENHTFKRRKTEESVGAIELDDEVVGMLG